MQNIVFCQSLCFRIQLGQIDIGARSILVIAINNKYHFLEKSLRKIVIIITIVLTQSSAIVTFMKQTLEYDILLLSYSYHTINLVLYMQSHLTIYCHSVSESLSACMASLS